MRGVWWVLAAGSLCAACSYPDVSFDGDASSDDDARADSFTDGLAESAADTSEVDSSIGDGASDTTRPPDSTPTDTSPDTSMDSKGVTDTGPSDTAPPIDAVVCSAPTPTLCGTSCVDTSTDTKNCGGCSTICAAPGTCIAGKCALKCITSAPTVLFYPLGTREMPWLPTGAVAATVTETVWKAMTTAEFAKYDLIIIGEPNGPTSTGPLATQYQTAFDTRATWSAAIGGRIVVLGNDPAHHAGNSIAGAITFVKSCLRWATTGPTGRTALYVSSDWGLRALDFLAPVAAFSSTSSNTDVVTITDGSHPIMAGSTSASLSSWGTSAHSFLTVPSGFSALANATLATTGVVVAVRDAACTP